MIFGDNMEFVKKRMMGNKYLADGCEFKKINDEYQLVSTENYKYVPFIGEIIQEEGWDGISKADITSGEKHERLYRLLLDHFKLGNTIFNHESNILLKKGEHVVFKSLDYIVLKEPTSIQVSQSSHSGIGGINGKFMAGYGVSKTVSEIQEVIKPIDSGHFTITNKRFIYSGDKRNIDVNISQITAITPYVDGFKLQRKNKQKPEYFTDIDHLAFLCDFKNEIYFYRVNGDIIKSLIEGGLNEVPQKSKLDELESQTQNENKGVNFCSNCGYRVNSNDKFCGSCGSKLY